MCNNKSHNFHASMQAYNLLAVFGGGKSSNEDIKHQHITSGQLIEMSNCAGRMLLCAAVSLLIWFAWLKTMLSLRLHTLFKREEISSVLTLTLIKGHSKHSLNCYKQTICVVAFVGNKTQACKERVTSKQCSSLHFLNSSSYSGHGAIKKCQSRCAERRAMGQPQGFLGWFPLAQLNIDESEVLLTR